MNREQTNRHWRTLVRIEGVSIDEIKGPVAHTVMSTWDPHVVFDFPLSQIEDEEIRTHLQGDPDFPVRLIAWGRIGMDSSDDLDLKCFVWAPVPDESLLTDE